MVTRSARASRVGCALAVLGAWGAARADEPALTGPVLERAALVRAVWDRNPDVAAAQAAWRAAAARPAQVGAWDDPMLAYRLAPASAFASDARFGQAVEIRQRIPFPGKLDLAAEAARAEADMTRGEVEAVRLRLALAASRLFGEAYATARAIAITDAHAALLRELKAAALAQYEAGRAPQQDALMADVELGMLERRRLDLAADQAAVTVELNGLLHQAPDAPLPPAPPTLALPAEPALDAAALAAAAAARRPELTSARAGVTGAQAQVQAAAREFAPDFEVMGAYDGMWDMPAHRWMVGVGVNLPFFHLGRRRAAVDEAEARLQQTRREVARNEIQVKVDVEQTMLRLHQAYEAVRLYDERLLPVAKQQVESARIGFVSAGTPFVSVIEAERSLRGLELDAEMARADVVRRWAELESAVAAEPDALVKGGAP
jgi:outer membrane protein TolC